MIYLNVFKELFSRPPAQGINVAITKVNLDVNNKYMMKSATRLRQLSLHTFFLSFFFIKTPSISKKVVFQLCFTD